MAHFVDGHCGVAVFWGGGGVALLLLVRGRKEGSKLIVPVTNIVRVVEVRGEFRFANGFIITESEDELVEGGGAGCVTFDAQVMVVRAAGVPVLIVEFSGFGAGDGGTGPGDGIC